jgi:hypothetical protein
MSAARIVTLAGLSFFLLAEGCRCSPGEISADPDCPDGRAAAATLVVEGQLAGIRPVDAPKDIQVRGNRVSTDPCFVEGARSAFSLRLQGTTTVTTTESNLAPGDWSFNVAALSGGDHDPLTLPRNLAPGSTVTLRLEATAAGDIQASWP